jgi:CBS domain-containing protein
MEGLMRIANVLRAKGTVVATVPSGAFVADLLAVMAQSRVGAVVVVQDDAVVGMVWERDVVRLLHERGTALVGAVVSEIMNADVVGCLPTDDVDDILRTMTDRRIRHLPVVIDGKLSGIVSMGDLVKARISELEADRAYLESYIGAP